MIRNLSLKKKIFLGYVVLLSLFVGAILIFSNFLVKRIIIQSMEGQANDLIRKLQRAPSEDELVAFLKAEKPQIFFRVAIIAGDKRVLYDSHTKRVLKEEFSQEFKIDHTEVNQALRAGTGYHEAYSKLLDQNFAYLARKFTLNGKTYVLRTAFPFTYVERLLDDFELGFLVLTTFGLLAFTVLTWYVVHRLTSPISEIIRVVHPYQQGRVEELPIIELKRSNPSDEWGQLASTLNSLSARVRTYIHSLIEERSRRDAILESLNEGVLAIDKKMHVTFANRQALELLGFNPEQLLDHPFSEAKRPECTQLLEECASQKTIQKSSIDLKVDGKRRYINAIAIPIKREAGMVLVLQDLTSQHKIMEMRKDFVANASHELKTPITIMMGFSETLVENDNIPAATIKEVASKIHRNSTRMNQIIEDLLILSDIENLPPSRIELCNLKVLVDQCAMILKEVYKGAEISIINQLDSDPVINADPYLIELAFNNLFNNAAKYSEGTAKITVTFRKVGDLLAIDVADQGIGIPEGDIEFLFHRFYTVDKARSRKMGGSGLGLSIVSTIVEKHGGNISATSKVGQGSTFTMTF